MAEARLRRAVRRFDVISGASALPVRLAARPRIVAVDAQVGDDVRRVLMEIVDAVSRGDTVAGVHALARESTGVSFEWDPGAHPAGRTLVETMRATFALGDARAPSLRLRRYGVGEWHRMHGDHFVEDGLPLVATVIACLEAPELGGETAFALALPAPIAVPARAGRMLAFANHLGDGAIDHRSVHEGLVVRAGVKTTATWFVHADPSSCPFLHDALAAEELR